MTPERKKELIEQLKQNRVPYYLWTDEERAVADLIPRKWWLCDVLKNGDFEPCYDPKTTLGDNAAERSVYRLKPGYESPAGQKGE